MSEDRLKKALMFILSIKYKVLPEVRTHAGESEVQTLSQCLISLKDQLFYSYKDILGLLHILVTPASTHKQLHAHRPWPPTPWYPLSAPPCCTQGVETLSSSGPFSIPFTFQCGNNF